MDTLTRTRESAIVELVEIFTELYANEPADTYDISGAREYWGTISLSELQLELDSARTRLAEFKKN